MIGVNDGADRMNGAACVPGIHSQGIVHTLYQSNNWGYYMYNQLILWSVFVLPWFTLFLMKKQDIKRYMPVGLFAVFTSAIILETGETLKWWIYHETAYPLRNISYLYGAIPVSTMWLLKFLHGRFWLFVVCDLLLNLFYTLVFENYFLGGRKIIQFVKMTPMVDVLATSALGIVIYGFHVWQAGIFKPEEE